MWSSIEEQLLYYSELTPAERLHVDQQVQQRPELIALLEEAKAFSVVLDEAQQLHTFPPSDEVLAYFIATRRVSRHPIPDSLQDAFDRIDEKVAGDASLRTRYAELVRRMTELEAASDPVQQFAQLSGHQLSLPTQDAALQNGDDQSNERTRVLPVHAERSPVIYRIWTHAGRWAVAAIVFGMVLYGSLALVSRFSQSDLDRLAVLDPSLLQAPDFPMRGGESSADATSPDALYHHALSILREARTHTLGLFPYYDTARLREAGDILERVVDLEDPASTLRSEANYVLAEVRLAQKNVDGARVALQAVLNGSGLKAEEAQLLLDQIDTFD